MVPVQEFYETIMPKHAVGRLIEHTKPLELYLSNKVNKDFRSIVVLELADTKEFMWRWVCAAAITDVKKVQENQDQRLRAEQLVSYSHFNNRHLRFIELYSLHNKNEYVILDSITNYNKHCEQPYSWDGTKKVSVPNTFSERLK